MKILVVDDEPLVGKAISDFIRGREVLGERISEILLAETCHEAESLVEATQFDCVILDWVLRGSRAGECISKIRQLSPFIGIIVVTGYEDIEYATQSFARGADDFVPKTAMTTQLVSAINTVLQYKRDRRGEVDSLAKRIRNIENLRQSVRKGLQDIHELRNRNRAG